MTIRRTIAICAVLAGPAAAGDAPSQFVTRLMGRTPEKGETVACFSRTYHDARLAANARQNVTAAWVLVVAYPSLQ